MGSLSAQNICDLLEGLAPTFLAEPWDNVGLLVGNPASPVSGILVGLDPVAALLDEAVALQADLIITHHPVIFHPLHCLRTDQVMGGLLASALSAGITMVACHTNLDSAANGVNDILAARLALQAKRPLKTHTADNGCGMGRIGTLATPVAGDAFLSRVLAALGVSQVRFAGRLPESVATVAVCGGSGDDFTQAAFDAGADIYLTGEIKLSTARWVEEAGFCVVDAGHYATELPVVEHLAGMISRHLKKQGHHLPVAASIRQKDPFHIFHHPMQTGKQQP